MIGRALDRMQRVLANSRAGLYVATKLRNQCNLVIGKAHAVTRDAELNGEALWLRTAGSLRYVVDVGANKGDWTGLVLESGKVERALLFEPSLSALKLLRNRFAGHAEVEIVEAAASNAPGVASFFEEDAAGETSSLVAGFSAQGKERQVPLTTVDAELDKRGWTEVDFLKIDAEGFDFHVLEGCRRLLRDRKVRYGQFEYNAPWRLCGATLAYAVRWLRDLGYECLVIKADGLHRPKTEFYREYYAYSNYAMVREDLAEDAVRRSHSGGGR